MVNVVFSQTVAGSLRRTREPGADSRIAKKEILCLEWMLDIGFLSEDINSKYRKELPGKLIMQGCYGDECEKGIPEIGEENIKNWKTLMRNLEKKRPIRIWYSDFPSSLCGFYHVCTLARDYDAEVFAMHAPKVAKDDTNWYLARSWGMFNQESISEYFGVQRILDKKEIQTYAKHWDELVKQNAPLRAVISGIPISVNEDFYDHFIEGRITHEPIKEATVMASIYDELNLGVESSWIEARIQKMIDVGKVKVVEDAEEYATRRIIQKC